LRWAIAGCLAWQRAGLAPPAEVLAATTEYRTSQDVIGRFIEECCLISPQVRSKATELYTAYTSWCETGNETVVTMTAFGNRLEAQGFAKHHSGGIWRLGIALLAPARE